MSDISDMLGGWQGDPDELRNQEALFAMYSRQAQSGSPNSYPYGSHEQALVPRQGFESQGLQNIRNMAGSGGYNRVPIWQAQSGFGQSPFQRLGYSMMFSSYTGGSRNIFTPTGSQRRGPLFLIIGGTCRSSMFSGIPTESIYSQMPTDNTWDGPIITELPNTPDEEEQKCLEFPPVQGKSSLSSNKHKNKLPVPSKFEPELKELDYLSDEKIKINETDIQKYSDNTSMETLDSNPNKSKAEDVSPSTDLESNDYSSLSSVSVHDNTENTTHTETEENKNSELAEKNAIGTTEPEIETIITNTLEFDSEDEMVPLALDVKQNNNRTQCLNEGCMPPNSKKKDFSRITTQEKYNKNYIEDKEGRCKEKSDKERNENEIKRVQNRTNLLTVQFNLGHLDKTERRSSEAIKTEKTKNDEKSKHSSTSSKTAVKEPTYVYCSSKENKTDLSAQTLTLLSEKEDDFLSIDEYKNCLTEPSGFETAPPNRNSDTEINSACGYSERMEEITATSVSKSCSEVEWPFEENFQADPTNTPVRADSTAAYENLANQDFPTGNTALNEGPESVNPFDGDDGAYTGSTGDFHNNVEWHSEEPMAEPRTPTHHPAVWHQDQQYGAEGERGSHYLEMVSNLRGLVAKEGLMVKDVYPDGNCLFAAVVDQLRVRGEFYFTPKTLRKAAVEHLKQYPFMPDGTPLFCFVTDASWEAYLIRMTKEGEWGDHLIISAISSVLKRKLIILGGLSGLSRTVQEPDHAYKEITREMKRPSTSPSNDPCNGESDGQKDNGVKEYPKQQWQTVNPEVKTDEEEAESLYLGHLAESHYVSLRRRDWEHELHTILRNKKDSDLLTYRSGKKFSDEGNGQDASGSETDSQAFTTSPHSNFLLKVIISRCMFSFEPNLPDLLDTTRQNKTEFAFTGPLPDRLYAGILDINFETVWNRRGLPPEEKKEPASHELGECVHIVTATDSFAADTRTGLNCKDLLIDSSRCRPGYTRLIPVKPSVWMLNAVKGLDGEVYLKQLHLKRTKDELEKLNKVACLLAFKCHWPEVAFEWLERERPHDWPPRSFISQIEEEGCRVVTLSHSFTEEKDIEWMFSFAIAEKMLAREATSKIQRSCFQFLTLLLSYSLGNQSKISYFHLKSVFFYACERLNQQTWDQTPAFCVSEMIRYLTEGFEARFLPCYFVKSNNIIDDFTDSELMFHTERLENLHRHFIVSVYFMLDMKGQIVANLHLVFDNVVSDYQQYQEHRHLGTSVAECFLPCIEKHICLYASSKFYNKMIDLASEAAAELNTTFAYEITVKDLLLQAIQTLPLDKGWLCAFFADQKLPLSLTDRVCEGLNTVSLLDFLGEEILSGVTSAGNDIRVPEELVTVDNITTFISEFTKLLKDDLNVGSDIYMKAWLFFLDMHLNSVMQFIRTPCAAVNPVEQRLVATKQQAAILCLQNALMTIRLEIKDPKEELAVNKLREIDYYLKILEGT